MIDRARTRVVIAAAAIALLSLVSTDTRAVTPGSIVAPPDTSTVYSAMERARLALIAEKYQDATREIDSALQQPEFAAVPKPVQFRAFLFAALAAQGREDYLGAHEFSVIATGYPDADANAWIMRTRYAYWVDNYADAGVALTRVARQFPKSLSELTDRTIQRIAYEMREDKKLAAERLELLNALFGADFTGDWGTQPADLWRELVLDALARKDAKRAAEVLKRITHPRVLVNMRIDRRFDALVQAEPRSFDVVAAAKAECKRWQQVMEANPSKLEPVTRYMGALQVVGGNEEVIALADRILAKQATGTKDKPAFEDEKDELNWIYDIRSRSLRRLGRWDDALAVQVKAREMRETSSDKVSQAINLGSFYAGLDRPDDALKALDGIDWANSMSGYGRMQYQSVRLRAYLAKGDRTEAEKVFAYMRENKNDAPDTWQDAMLVWGDLDGAAALYISRLRDPEERTEALFAAQTFVEPPRTPRRAEEHALWEALMARPDVSAAIAEVGRREKYPIWNPWD